MARVVKVMAQAWGAWNSGCTEANANRFTASELRWVRASRRKSVDRGVVGGRRVRFMRKQGLHNPISAWQRHGVGQIAWAQTLIVGVALAGLLVARSFPTEFPSAPRAHTVIGVHSTHDQRPRFDTAGWQFSIPIARFAGIPPASEHDGASFATALAVPCLISGSQYTRPPPVSYPFPQYFA
jgi:hypothetical protein